MGLAFDKLGVSFSHLVGKHVDKLVKERLLDIELVAVTEPAADDAAKHVRAVFVAGHNPIGNEECARPDVVGNHP